MSEQQPSMSSVDPASKDDYIYNRLLKERIIWLGSEVRDDNANETHLSIVYNNFKISSARSTKCVAPVSISSSRERKPHVTPTERTPAARAVRISTPESPT